MKELGGTANEGPERVTTGAGLGENDSRWEELTGVGWVIEVER